MIIAAEQLLEAGERNFALLFVVGEERNSAGALRGRKDPRGSKYIINGEPTENKLALGSKGALRYEVVAQRPDGAFGLSGAGRIGDREAARRARTDPPRQAAGRYDSWAEHAEHRHHRGGRAPNVIPDEARAEIFIRLVDDRRTPRVQMPTGG